jgi:nicotinate-nucleotide adenylyltransferase
LRYLLGRVAKKIGIYGGTFDPIHHAHLILARAALEQLQLERIVFVPAALSPHKRTETPTVGHIRLEMLRAALAGEASFEIEEMELNRPAPSFAIDTIEELKRRENETQFYYLIGSDNLPRLDTWHRLDGLREAVQFVVLERGATPPHLPYPTVHRHIDISATEIRNRVAKGLSIRYLVPPAVEELIRRHHLYQDSYRSLRKT